MKWADTDKERVVRRHQKLTDSFVPAGERAPVTAAYAHNMPSKMGGMDIVGHGGDGVWSSFLLRIRLVEFTRNILHLICVVGGNIPT